MAYHFTENTLVLFCPVEARFVQFDGFCARIENGTLINVCGYQCKDNRKGATGTVPEWINKYGHLLRSEAPKQCRTIGVNNNRWRYQNSLETDVFLGWSLRVIKKN